MKRYIGNRSPVKRRVDGRQVSPSEAGVAFLVTVLTSVGESEQIDKEEEVAFTVPVESFEHYENWLGEVAMATGMPRFRLIDEPSAAALGYGTNLQAGRTYVVVDFGGSSLDVAVVRVESSTQPSAMSCRVLGKAGADIGGSVIDEWMFQEVLKKNHLRCADDIAPTSCRSLLIQCELVKERLSDHPGAHLTLTHRNGRTITETFTRADFEELLDQHSLFTSLDRTIHRALGTARERGVAEKDIEAAFLIGGTSTIPSVQKMAQRILGRDLVKLHRPLDAVATGAAAFVAGVNVSDYIQHDYALRWFDSSTDAYDYDVLIKKGTTYPSTFPSERRILKATHDGQTHLGLAVFELGETRGQADGEDFELLFDPNGSVQLLALTRQAREQKSSFWLNERNPTFLVANPPAKKGEARFEIEFGIDINRRLLITARDITTNTFSYRDHPVVKLT